MKYKKNQNYSKHTINRLGDILDKINSLRHHTIRFYTYIN